MSLNSIAVLHCWPRLCLSGFMGWLLACGSAFVCAQSDVDQPLDPVTLSWANSEELAACFRCHANAVPADPTLPGPKDLNLYSRATELRLWYKQDKHAIARRRVEPLTKVEIADVKKKDIEHFTREPHLINQWVGESNLLSRKICEQLGYVTTDAKFSDEGYHKFRDQCLTCHGGFHVPAAGQNITPDTGFELTGNQQPGIKCNYCHQEGDNLAWVESHGGNPKAWRLMTPDAKSAQGMRDLVNTSKQAALCNDCHIGNIATNRFVSHDMYAAGHPPLPSIELETFAHKMPQHWRTSGELYQALTSAKAPDRDAYFKANFPGLLNQPNVAIDQIYWNTRTLLISALVARKHWINLVTDATKQPATWGDYALYDCAACHHELRVASARQTRGYPGAPGRPRQMEWPYALLTAALDVSGNAVSVEASEKELIAAFASQPFGDAARCITAAGQVDKELSKALSTLEKIQVDASIARKLIERLAQTDKSLLLDYHAARQVAWALQVIDDELTSRNAPLPPNASKIIRELGSLDIDEPSGVFTGLPSGREKFIYPDELAAELERRAAYDGERFANRLDALQAALK